MNYYSEIKVCIKQIGQAKIEFNNNVKDYTFNGKSPDEIAGDYLTKLNEQFETNLLVLIRQGCTVEKITKLIKLSKDTINALKLSGDNHRVSFLLDNNKGVLSDNSTSTHDTINRIISTQKLVTGPSPGTNPPIYPVVKVDKTRRTETTGTLKVCRYI